MVYIALAAAAAMIGIDQLTKWLAVTNLKPVETISLLKFGDTEVLNLTYCENTGAAFSLLEGKQIFLIIITAVAILAALYLLVSKRIKNVGYIWSISLLIGGGVGNLIDRAVNGFVVDFIDFRLINFAVFNFADICAVCGCIALLFFFVLDEIKTAKQKKASSEKPAQDKDTSSEAIEKNETEQDNSRGIDEQS